MRPRKKTNGLTFHGPYVGCLRFREPFFLMVFQKESTQKLGIRSSSPTNSLNNKTGPVLFIAGPGGYGDMVDVWRVNKTQGFKVWIIYVSLKVDIQLVFSGILGDYTVTHKHPLYRAYIRIFPRGSTLGSGYIQLSADQVLGFSFWWFCWTCR